jgi:Cap4 SAVED domain
MTSNALVPETILELVVEYVDELLPTSVVCAGFEDGAWRSEDLSFDLIAWAADWILPPEELKGYSHANGVALLGKALSRVYKTIDYEKRGEIGELLLHIILRKFFLSSRLISRIYFKDAANDTVKGFDCAHIVESPDGAEIELWLGESKLYQDSYSAATAIYDELKLHLSRDYLKYEFAAISDKIPQDHPHRQNITKLLSREASLDQTFKSVVVPIFISYDSEAAGNHLESTEEYISDLQAEVHANWDSLSGRYGKWTLPRKIRAHVIYFPMSTKAALTSAFDGRLKAWQSTTKI